MGFPHLLRPPVPSLELWLREIFSKKIARWTWTFFNWNKYDARREDRRFHKIPINRG